jgi:hypothetical protein
MDCGSAQSVHISPEFGPISFCIAVAFLLAGEATFQKPGPSLPPCLLDTAFNPNPAASSNHFPVLIPRISSPPPYWGSERKKKNNSYPSFSADAALPRAREIF